MFKKIILLMVITASFATSAADCSRHIKKAEDALGHAKAFAAYSDALNIALMDAQRRNSSFFGGMMVSDREIRFLELMVSDAETTSETYESIYGASLSLYRSCELIENDKSVSQEESEALLDSIQIELIKLNKLEELLD